MYIDIYKACVHAIWNKILLQYPSFLCSNIECKKFHPLILLISARSICQDFTRKWRNATHPKALRGQLTFFSCKSNYRVRIQPVWELTCIKRSLIILDCRTFFRSWWGDGFSLSSLYIKDFSCKGGWKDSVILYDVREIVIFRK